MGRTIIQPIGPLYGEAVNGTVFGRPNGSIYIPETNQISLELSEDYITNNNTGAIIVCKSDGSTAGAYATAVAKAQDIAAYIQIEISDSVDFDSESLSYRSFSAGLFNVRGYATIGTNSYFTIVNGSTYYVRACLMSSTGVAVAVSEVKTVEGVAE